MKTYKQIKGFLVSSLVAITLLMGNCLVFAEDVDPQFVAGLGNIMCFNPNTELSDVREAFSNNGITVESVSDQNGLEEIEILFLSTTEDPISTNCGYIFVKNKLEVVSIPIDGSYDLEQVRSDFTTEYGNPVYTDDAGKTCQIWSIENSWTILITDEYGILFLDKNGTYITESGLSNSINDLYGIDILEYL